MLMAVSVAARDNTNVRSRVQAGATSDEDRVHIVRDAAASIHETSRDGENATRELSFLSSFFQAVVHGCPPGPLGHDCRLHHAANSGGSGGGGGSGGSGGSSSSSGGDSSSSGGDGSWAASTGSDGSDSSNASNGGSNGHNKVATNNALIVGMVGAASVAVAALYMGTRKRDVVEQVHPLHGTLKKRMGLFSRLAERSACATCRPEDINKAISEENDLSSADYRMA